MKKIRDVIREINTKITIIAGKRTAGLVEVMVICGKCEGYSHECVCGKCVCLRLFCLRRLLPFMAVPACRSPVSSSGHDGDVRVCCGGEDGRIGLYDCLTVTPVT